MEGRPAAPRRARAMPDGKTKGFGRRDRRGEDEYRLHRIARDEGKQGSKPKGAGGDTILERKCSAKGTGRTDGNSERPSKVSPKTEKHGAAGKEPDYYPGSGQDDKKDWSRCSANYQARTTGDYNPYQDWGATDWESAISWNSDEWATGEPDAWQENRTSSPVAISLEYRGTQVVKATILGD